MGNTWVILTKCSPTEPAGEHFKGQASGTEQ